jgi:transposase
MRSSGFHARLPPPGNFRAIDRETGFLLPPSIDEWLPEKHLARFVVEVIDGLDLSGMVGSYRGSGSASYHPALLLGVLVYGYATGVFSSRKLERATYDSVAFRFITANAHPDHDTIATFRRRFLKEIEELFVRVLELAREMGMLKMGTVALDGTKIHANASRHSALSYEHAGKIEEQGRSGRPDGAGRGCRCGRSCGRHVDPRGAGTPRGPFGKACRGPAPRLKPAPRSVSSGRRPSIARSRRRGKPRPRPLARSPAASHLRLRSRGRSPRTRSI